MVSFDRVEELIEKAKEPLSDTWLEDVQSAHGGSGHCHHRFLHLLALELKPALSVELGVQSGITSAYLCAAAKQFGGYVIGVDTQYHHRPAKVLPERFGNYSFIWMNSLEVKMESVLTDEGKIGLVYQDSLHYYEHFKQEFEMLSPFLDDEAVWISNLMPHPRDHKYPYGMINYWRWLPLNKRKYDSLYIGADVGVGLVQ